MVDIFGWMEGIWYGGTEASDLRRTLYQATTLEELNAFWKGAAQAQRDDPANSETYLSMSVMLAQRKLHGTDPLQAWIKTALKLWKEKVDGIGKPTPENAEDVLATITEYALVAAAGATAVDLAAGTLPNDEGTVSSNATRQMLTALGFGAVIAAAAHDPVKIGLLRPYQDSLEMHFRNRRPDDMALFQAYRTRELTATKVEDLALLDDVKMNLIETQNQLIYDTEIAKWGYSVDFAGALARSATRTLNFSQLVTLARAGIYNKGFAIYSLWGEGLDRVCMPQALDALETLQEREMYSGFRSMIEPSYVDGSISEDDLITYWRLAGVPEKVRVWILPRMRQRRVASEIKARGDTITKEKDLTVSQIQLAYQDALIDRAKAKGDIISLGYDAGETDILLNISELRRKTPSIAKLKRLTLTDYEKAYKNKIISLEQVMERMTGEYATSDIALERQLLIIGKA